MHRRSLAIALSCSLLPLTAIVGCSGSTASGTSYSITPLRELEAYLPGSIGQVHDAAVTTLREDLGYEMTQDRQDALEGIVKAKTARGNEVRVETFREAENVTKVQVHVGPLGDEQQARAVLQAIEQRVKNARGSR